MIPGLSIRQITATFAKDPAEAYNLVYDYFRAEWGVDAMYVAYCDWTTETLIFPYNVEDGIVEQGLVTPLARGPRPGPTSRAIREARVVLIESRADFDEYDFIYFGDQQRRTLSQAHIPFRPMDPNWTRGPHGVISIQRWERIAFPERAISIAQDVGVVFATLRHADDLWQSAHRSAQALQKRLQDRAAELGKVAREATAQQVRLQALPHCDEDLLRLLRRVSSLAIDDDGAPALQRPRATPLTPRERQVLSLLPRSNKEIAAAIGVKERTVKHHIAQLFGKLAVRSRGELVALALKWDLV